MTYYYLDGAKLNMTRPRQNPIPTLLFPRVPRFISSQFHKYYYMSRERGTILSISLNLLERIPLAYAKYLGSFLRPTAPT